RLTYIIGHATLATRPCPRVHRIRWNLPLVAFLAVASELSLDRIIHPHSYNAHTHQGNSHKEK
ncbi:MAG: hypothetical protein MUO97_01575, partial [Dehalococcoidia bacterium]|nr:hypothetical protein [Dehalococcoidia bacterium]